MNLRLAGLTSCLFFLATLTLGAQEKSNPAKGTVKAEDGLHIVYDVRGNGDTALVFIHGWCGDRTWWKHQADAFAGDYKIVTIDLGGHGESGKDRKKWSALGLAGDVQAVIKQLGFKRVILVGHSMGGPIALEAARRMPGAVVGVIGVDTLTNAEYVWPEDRARELVASFEADFKGFMRSAIRGMLPDKVDPELLKAISAKAEAQDPAIAVAIFRDLPRLDTKALLKEAKVPVRCINSAGGFQFYAPTTSEINKKYADYNAVLIEDVGHFPMLEKPAEFNKKLGEVVKELAAKRK